MVQDVGVKPTHAAVRGRDDTWQMDSRHQWEAAYVRAASDMTARVSLPVSTTVQHSYAVSQHHFTSEAAQNRFLARS